MTTQPNTIAQALPTAKTTVGNQLIKTINARDLHTWLESKQDFSTWIKNRIGQYGFEENVDFIKLHKKMELSKTGQTAIEYHITLDMAKELSMVERTEKGRAARKYFIACEQVALAKLKDHSQHTNWTVHQVITSLKNAITMQGRNMGKLISLQEQSLDLQSQTLELQQQTLTLLDKHTTRKRYKPASNEDYLKTKQMLKDGNSFAYISEALGISKNSVYNIKHDIFTLGADGMCIRQPRPSVSANISIQTS